MKKKVRIHIGKRHFLGKDRSDKYHMPYGNGHTRRLSGASESLMLVHDFDETVEEQCLLRLEHVLSVLTSNE